jgi:ribonuclease HI
MLITPKGEEIGYVVKMGFKATNNKAEYKAVLARLAMARKYEQIPK